MLLGITSWLILSINEQEVRKQVDIYSIVIILLCENGIEYAIMIHFSGHLQETEPMVMDTRRVLESDSKQ